MAPRDQAMFEGNRTEMRTRQVQTTDLEDGNIRSPINKPETPTSDITETSTSSIAEIKEKAPVVSSMGLKVLCLLAVQNCSKNLLVRYVMKDQPKFLTSAAVIGSELVKLALSTLYILLVEKRDFQTIIDFLRKDWRTSMLVIVPASAYNLQMTLEYVAMANLDAAMFSVLVQSKLVFTASFAALVLGKKLKRIQGISLALLTSGVMLCNLSRMNNSSDKDEDGFFMDSTMVKGVTATLGIAMSSGFASVYTEKVIKQHKKSLSENVAPPSLAYTQIQLAVMSLLAIGVYALVMDFTPIVEYGLFHNFSTGACCTVLMSALGGLTVAAVLKFADSILKGYATALSVILTGVISVFFFGTELNAIYYMGVINVVIAVLLYNGQDMDQMLC
ncbi:UDP-galactose translocator [Seminavis robusta]|uniref:UDP-galactose translocator n=1 Tax=Seminavis robusta TaxID=568900 RepID=A0A9N8DF08_9STRA|nr:UDP-galactose translocator [Seminavis robusta]|eukprot:Sro63_g035970.1 UDP-galactose translocator (389) ;mRNA; r:102625-104029